MSATDRPVKKKAYVTVGRLDIRVYATNEVRANSLFLARLLVLLSHGFECPQDTICPHDGSSVQAFRATHQQ